MKKVVQTRLINNYVTTLIGLLILFICLFFIYEGKESAENLSGWLTTALLFLRSKDSLIALPAKE
jgi:putative effector of murein hydrolase LrgA (UPF0299 family)